MRPTWVRHITSKMSNGLHQLMARVMRNASPLKKIDSSEGIWLNMYAPEAARSGKSEAMQDPWKLRLDNGATSKLARKGGQKTPLMVIENACTRSLTTIRVKGTTIVNLHPTFKRGKPLNIGTSSALLGAMVLKFITCIQDLCHQGIGPSN